MELIFDMAKAKVFLGVFLCACIFVIVSILLDLWDGVYTAKVTGERIHSHKLRVTIAKMSEYWRFIMLGMLVDCIGFLLHCLNVTFFGIAFCEFYIIPFLALVFSVGLIAVEGKSMREHARRRKSHTADVPQIVQDIIKCAKEKDARKIIEIITGGTEDDESK